MGTLAHFTDAVVVRCFCGQVVFHLKGKPIITSVCHCDDCQEASGRLELMPQAPHILDEARGTAYVLWRKDRFTCVQGSSFLEDFRIERETLTKRVTTSCCHSPLYLDFEKGHWVSFYRDRFVVRPELQIRIQTKYVPTGIVIPNDVAHYPGFPLKLIMRLLGAKLAMMIGR